MVAGATRGVGRTGRERRARLAGPMLEAELNYVKPWPDEKRLGRAFTLKGRLQR